MKAMAAAIIIALVAFLLVGIQQYRVIALQGQVTIQTAAVKSAVDANLESQTTITTLRGEIERNKAYQSDLDKRLKASEQKAVQARRDFEQLKRSSPAVRNWATQPLPDGLRGKASGGNKDDSSKARTP